MSAGAIGAVSVDTCVDRETQGRPGGDVGAQRIVRSWLLFTDPVAATQAAILAAGATPVRGIAVSF